ncbi:unnamed protein product, partial [Notodromas monacha]
MMRWRKTGKTVVASATVIIVWSSGLLLLLPPSSLAQDEDETKAGDSRNSSCSDGECEPESCPAAEGCRAGFTLESGPVGVLHSVCRESGGQVRLQYYNSNSDDDEDTSSNVDRASQGSSTSSSSSRNTRLFGDCGDNLECRLRDDNRSSGPPASPAAPSPRSEWASMGMQPWQARPAAGPCPPSRGRRCGHHQTAVISCSQVMSVQPHDGGRYTCVATNNLGEARAESQLGGSTR